MSRGKGWLAGSWALIVLAGAVVGADVFAEEPAPPEPRRPRQETPAEIFRRLDTNKDGVLSLAEFEKYVREVREAQAGRPRPRLSEGTRVERNLAYGPYGGRNRLDLYLPPGAKGPLPLIIWIHGGAWLGGSKDEGNPALPLLGRGYAVASINYRLSQQARFPAQIEDCKAAVRFLRANAKKYGLDPKRFGVWGASAGGHLVALLGTSGGVKELEGDGPNQGVSSRVQAVCDWFGPVDLLKMGEQSGPHSQLRHDAPDSPESRLLGGPVQERKELARRANPSTYIDKDDPPFLIFHGDHDDLVPVQQSRMLDKALKAAGVESTLVVVSGGGHGPGIGTPENLKKIEKFFDRHLKERPDR
jgi:acetyl esterase/lipase